MRIYKTCVLSLLGCLFGLVVVHYTAFSIALNDKAMHATRRDAQWQAVFYDFLVGIPIAGLCGWGVASYLKIKQEKAADDDIEDDTSQSGND